MNLGNHPNDTTPPALGYWSNEIEKAIVDWLTIVEHVLIILDYHQAGVFALWFDSVVSGCHDPAI